MYHLTEQNNRSDIDTAFVLWIVMMNSGVWYYFYSEMSKASKLEYATWIGRRMNAQEQFSALLD